MKYEQSVKDIYKIAGMLEMLTCMRDKPLTSGMVAELVDAVDKLELIGARLLHEDYAHLIDKYDKLRLETEVSAHEGTEESPPSPQPPDQ